MFSNYLTVIQSHFKLQIKTRKSWIHLSYINKQHTPSIISNKPGLKIHCQVILGIFSWVVPQRSHTHLKGRTTAPSRDWMTTRQWWLRNSNPNWLVESTDWLKESFPEMVERMNSEGSSRVNVKILLKMAEDPVETSSFVIAVLLRFVGSSRSSASKRRGFATANRTDSFGEKRENLRWNFGKCFDRLLSIRWPPVFRPSPAPELEPCGGMWCGWGNRK